MIFIHNRVRTHRVDTQRITKIIEVVLGELGYQDFDISVLLTTNAGIRKYNRDFRHQDKATDVLSFPYHADLKPGQRIKVHTDDDRNLGDMVISLEYVAQAAPHLGVTFANRLEYLLIHGICHLLGYDHIQDKDYRVMDRLEKSLLRKTSGLI